MFVNLASVAASPDTATSRHPFTDGITEAEDASSKQFGRERLARCLEALPKDTAAGAMLDALRAEVSALVAGAQASDDLALLVVRWLGSVDTLNGS
jgi:serine phosphatase RsbU (regulator of sigma subunit)